MGARGAGGLLARAAHERTKKLCSRGTATRTGLRKLPFVFSAVRRTLGPFSSAPLEFREIFTVETAGVYKREFRSHVAQTTPLKPADPALTLHR